MSSAVAEERTATGALSRSPASSQVRGPDLLLDPVGHRLLLDHHANSLAAAVERGRCRRRRRRRGAPRSARGGRRRRRRWRRRGRRRRNRRGRAGPPPSSLRGSPPCRPRSPRHHGRGPRNGGAERWKLASTASLGLAWWVRRSYARWPPESSVRGTGLVAVANYLVVASFASSTGGCARRSRHRRRAARAEVIVVAGVVTVVVRTSGGFFAAGDRGASALPALSGSDEIPIFWLTICVARKAIAAAIRSPMRARSGQRRGDGIIATLLQRRPPRHAREARSQHARRRPRHGSRP